VKICFVCSEYPPSPHGGIGTFTQVIARALVRAGHVVRVIGVYDGSHGQPPYAEDHGIGVWRIAEPATPMGWVYARYVLFRTISQWAERDEIDLIEVPDWQGWAAGWGSLPVPVITRANGSGTYFAREAGRRAKSVTVWLERESLRRSDYWVAVSRYTAEKTRRAFHLQAPAAAVIYNAVDVPAVTPDSALRRDVLFAGTLTEKKGILPLIQAWRAVVRQHPDAKLEIFGKDGTSPQGGSMKAFIESQLTGDVARSIIFHGHVGRERLIAAMQRARVAVFPSYAEAFAIAPLEAMACGCPTVSSNRGSGLELFENGRDGLAVDPDEPQQIAAAISRVLADDNLARSLGRAGSVRVRENFSIDRLLPLNESFFRECVSSFCRRAGTAA
jgi:glycosyltransferase involved in cell wall biosynthesis